MQVNTNFNTSQDLRKNNVQSMPAFGAVLWAYPKDIAAVKDILMVESAANHPTLKYSNLDAIREEFKLISEQFKFEKLAKVFSELTSELPGIVRLEVDKNSLRKFLKTKAGSAPKLSVLYKNRELHKETEFIRKEPDKRKKNIHPMYLSFRDDRDRGPILQILDEVLNIILENKANSSVVQGDLFLKSFDSKWDEVKKTCLRAISSVQNR